MHIHILGICGTFMGGIALLARAAGHRVTGCDSNVYPPMSTQLAEQGIELTEGYDAAQTRLGPDLYVIGNAISRSNPLLEAILDGHLPYVSGPQWLSEHVLRDKWVLAVAGTHGKTTTASLLAWILEAAGMQPGFLIGGIPQNFGISARMGGTPFFVIEADEYDTAFCDKRSKFIHYRPRTLVLNNLEFDHADIFADLAAIERQFAHLIRTIPASGLIVSNADCPALDRALAQGCWTPVEYFGDLAVRGTWKASGDDAQGFLSVEHQGKLIGHTQWALTGAHNRLNALAALIAARSVGVPVAQGLDSLSGFSGVKRRMEIRGVVDSITVYDDFAHHPTAIATTIAGLRRKVGRARILAIFEPRSNTMKLGSMKEALPASLAEADLAFCLSGSLGWDAGQVLAPLGNKAEAIDSLEQLIERIITVARPGDHLLVMSNGGFGGIHRKLLDGLAAHEECARDQLS